MNTRIIPLILTALLIAASLGLAGCGRSGDEAGQATSGQKFHCPMHPTYVSARLGDCPICNMKLVPIAGDKPAKPATAAAAYQPKMGEYFCPMKCPGSITNQPGDCPECGMDLLVMNEQNAHELEEDEPSPAPPPGRVAFHLSPEKRQLIGLRLAPVEQRTLTNVITAPAVVAHDETRYVRVAPRFGGWVRQLHVAFNGAPIEKGQPLFTAYSPELLAAGNEYLVAWRGRQQLAADAPALQRAAADSLLQAARRRLELWEVGPEDIRKLEQSGTASDELVFRAPRAGHVLARRALEGQAFAAGETLFELADLARVWIEARVTESDLVQLRPGLEAAITFPALDQRTFTAPVTFVDPHLDPATRRGRVRLELDNAEHLLRADMWATVRFQLPLGGKLVVPASAVLDTGERYLAFVDGPDGHLEPRAVQVGYRGADWWEVRDGLKEGENVVTRALFLVDSESQLKAAIAGMTSEPGGQP